MTTTRIGMLLFPRLTQLDLTGPFEVFAKWPDASVHLLWKTREPVAAETGMRILPDTTLAECPQLDVVCVPGGPGVAAMMEDAEVLAFLRAQARGARFVTSVCTGAMVLGAAGLLRGKRATTHWASHDLLGVVGCDSHQRPRRARRQSDYRWRRDGRHRFRADGGGGDRWSGCGAGHTAADRICTGAAV